MSGRRARLRVGLEKALWYLRLLRDTRGWKSRGAVVRWVCARNFAPHTPAGRAGSIRAQIGRFNLTFTDEEEIATYWQIEADIATGVLPSGAQARDWTVVDCGANIGLFSLFLGSAKRVLAIEPNPASRTILRRNLEANQVAATIIQGAVSARPGTLRLTAGGRSSVYAQVAEDGEVQVDAFTLDQIMARYGVEAVDLLKLDLEGHELDALRGATEALTKGRIHRVYSEFTSPEALSRMDGYLVGYGFERSATGSLNCRYDLRRLGSSKE